MTENLVVPPRSDARERPNPSEGQRRAALMFVLLAIVALGMVPWAGAVQTRPLYNDLNNVLTPARELLSRVQIALAIEASLLRDYLGGLDTSYTARYGQAVAAERQATQELEPLVGRLGPEVRERLAAFRRAQDEWHAAIDDLRDRGIAARRDPLRSTHYEELLASSQLLEAALASATVTRRATIQRAERLQGIAALPLGVLALGAALVVGWLGRRLRGYADSLEIHERQLEDAIEGRTRLMRGVTHDLRNPLQAIDGYADMLQNELQGPLSSQQRVSLGRIRESVRALVRLIDDLLDLARAEAGQLRVTPLPANVAQVVREIVEDHRAAATNAGHPLELAVHGLPEVITDAHRVRQVLGNLLSNAIKYTPPGGSIAVRAETRGPQTGAPSGPGRWIAIDVQNEGPGIPETQQQAIFTEFTRFDDAHHDVPGAGLGLSIARRVAHLLGGDLTLASAPGEGVRFTFWLPAEYRAPAKPSRAAAS